jgi:hypothetical protein
MLPGIYFCVFQAGIFQRGFPIEESYVFSFLPIPATYPTNPIPLYFAIIITVDLYERQGSWSCNIHLINIKVKVHPCTGTEAL